MAFTGDRVKETTTTVGAGTITLAGAVAQFQAFQTAFSVGSVIEYAIVGQTGTEWEVGEGILVTATTLSRDRVISSSNSNNIVTLSAGTKDVFATEIGRRLNTSNSGRTEAMARHQAMP